MNWRTRAVLPPLPTASTPMTLSIFAPAIAPPRSTRFLLRFSKPASAKPRFAFSRGAPVCPLGTAPPPLAWLPAYPTARRLRPSVLAWSSVAKPNCACWVSANSGCASMTSWRVWKYLPKKCPVPSRPKWQPPLQAASKPSASPTWPWTLRAIARGLLTKLFRPPASRPTKLRGEHNSCFFRSYNGDGPPQDAALLRRMNGAPSHTLLTAHAALGHLCPGRLQHRTFRQRRL